MSFLDELKATDPNLRTFEYVSNILDDTVDVSIRNYDDHILVVQKDGDREIGEAIHIENVNVANGLLDAIADYLGVVLIVLDQDEAAEAIELGYVEL